MNYLKIETFPEQNKIQFGEYSDYKQYNNMAIIKSIVGLFQSNMISLNFYDDLPKDINNNKFQQNYTNKEKVIIKNWLTEKLGMSPIIFIRLWNKTNIDFFEPDYQKNIDNILKEIENITDFPKLLIEVDEKNTRIIYGNYICEDVFFIKSMNQLSNSGIITKNFIDIWNKRGKYKYISRNKILTKYLGMCPTKFIKLWNAKVWNLFIENDKDFIRKHIFHKFSINKDIVCYDIKMRYFHKNKQLYYQAIDDNIQNILPIMLATGNTPKELKQILGKSIWKKITNNSYSRNNLLSYYVCNINKCFGLKEVLTYYLQFPSTVLKYKIGIVDENIYATKVTKPLKDRSQFIQNCDIFADTEHMSKQLNLLFNSNWSKKSMNEKHDEFIKLLNQRKYSTELIKNLEIIEPKSIVFENLEAILLTSPFDIYQEGLLMRHCVGSYIDRVVDEKYLVYSIKKDGERFLHWD